MRTSAVLTAGILAAALLGAFPAGASSSGWHDSEGGRVRLVTSGKPDSAGRLEGVLQIALKPGWKTYWRDPGDSGVPPQLDVAAGAGASHVSLSFPPPRRYDDGYGAWAGYDRSVSLPVVFTLNSPTDAPIDAQVFLGMCETICIPVQATLKLDPAADPDNAADMALVEAGFSSLPRPPTPDFEAKLLPGDHETMRVEALAPGDPASLDLFVAADGGYMFGTPQRSEAGGKVIFSVPVLDRPAGKPAGGGVPYTLSGSAGAVQGSLPYP